MRQAMRGTGLAAALSFLACSAGQVGAQVVTVYSNVTNFSGAAFAQGGAANQAGNTITTLAADNINLGSPGVAIHGFTFSVANLNPAAVSARPRARFYDSNGAGGGPGTFLAGFTFNPINFGANSVNLFSSGNSVSPLFTVPNTTFWAGLTFDDNGGTTGATLAQMNNLGQGIFNPPTIGSSTDVFFQTTSAGSFVANNPAGNLVNFGGTPVANFGWAFTGVPEPSTFVLGGVIVALAGAAGARRIWKSRRQLAGDPQAS